jgi:ribose 5-phosphate isomerase B
MSALHLPTLVLGSDHAGYPLKAALAEALRARDYPLIDVGADDATTRVDYPDYAYRAAARILAGEARFGVLVCGTGIGISTAANRFPHIRCALAHDVTTARLGREHNDANMIAFGARVIGAETAQDALFAFLAAEFQGGRHLPRIAKLSAPPAMDRPA